MTSQRKQTAVAALLVLALLLALPQVARADDTDISDPVLSEAQCAIVEDSAGNVLYEKNADTQMPMASITKVMTAMVASTQALTLTLPARFMQRTWAPIPRPRALWRVTPQRCASFSA